MQDIIANKTVQVNTNIRLMSKCISTLTIKLIIICITNKLCNKANGKINELNYMSTDLPHDVDRGNEDRNFQNWWEHLKQERVHEKVETG